MRQINAINFTPKYDALEDRIRLSINYDDFSNRIDYMVSRSMVLKLFPIVDEFMLNFYETELEDSIQTISEPKEKKISNEKSLTSQTDNTNLELYQQVDELLLEVKLSYIKNTKITLITFLSKDSSASAQLDERTLKQIFRLIKSTIPFFSWGISQNF